MSDERPRDITRGFGKRAWKTGHVATSALRLAARRVLRQEEGEADAALGEAIARELDDMKGMAMKVGQILSYFDGVLPDVTHAALRKLQTGASPVAFETVRAVVEESLGAPLEELFESFEREALAAASIGQVHGARYLGRDVVVKVQYPSVRETFAADLARVERLASLASLATAVDGLAIARELRERVYEECDYAREAEHQRTFRAAFAGDADVHIPAVIVERSAERVLTSERCAGLDLYRFCEVADRRHQDRAALVLVRFAYQSLFGLGALQADPHPGNYLFPDDEGPVVFLDFGCVRYFEPAWLEAERRLTRVVIDGERAAFEQALLATGMVADRRRFDFDVHWEMLRHQWAPYSVERFRFTREWLQRGVEFSRPGNPNLRRLRIPPPWIWLQRLVWGLHAVLVRLEAEGPFREVMRGALEQPLVPPSARRRGG